MTDYQATCHTPDNADPDRRLQGLGGLGWRHSIDTIIANIQSGRDRYWTTANGQSVWIEVKSHPRSHRLYIKTTADSYEPNNLLALPRCS